MPKREIEVKDGEFVLKEPIVKGSLDYVVKEAIKQEFEFITNNPNQIMKEGPWQSTEKSTDVRAVLSLTKKGLSYILVENSKKEYGIFEYNFTP